MAEAYAKCITYVDRGTVKTTRWNGSRTWTSESNFTTAFVRPDRFRFESELDEGAPFNSRRIVWQDGDHAQTWSNWDGSIEPSEADFIASRIAGDSSEYGVETVGTMLLEQPWVPDPTDIPAVAVEEAELDGSACYRLTVANERERAVLWIDQSDFLLRRIDGQIQISDSRSESITTFHPTINRTVAPSVLSFSPPEGLTGQGLLVRRLIFGWIPEKHLWKFLVPMIVACTAVLLLLFQKPLLGALRRWRDSLIGLP